MSHDDAGATQPAEVAARASEEPQQDNTATVEAAESAPVPEAAESEPVAPAPAPAAVDTPGPKVAVVSAGHAPPQPPPRQMTRDEFLRQMGLAPDDLVVQQSPSRIREYATATLSPPKPPVDTTPQPPAASGATADASPEVMEDDQWVRTTVFADASLIQESVAESNAANEAKKAILESYRATRTGGLSVDGGLTPRRSGEDQRAQDMVSKEDHAMASDYKSSLLEEYRRRKTKGEAKVPPQVSPNRERTAIPTA